MHQIKERKDIRLSRFTEDSKSWIRVDFPMTSPAKTIVKQLSDRKWNDRLQCLYIPDTKRHVAEVFRRFEDILWVDIKALYKKPRSKKSNQQTKQTKQTLKVNYNAAMISYEESLRLRRYSINTLKIYKHCFRQFLYYYNNIKPSDINQEMINAFMHNLVVKQKISESYQNQYINAIKYYYEKILLRESVRYSWVRPKVRKALPGVFSEKEVELLLKTVENLKHKCIRYLLYVPVPNSSPLGILYLVPAP